MEVLLGTKLDSIGLNMHGRKHESDTGEGVDGERSKIEMCCKMCKKSVKCIVKNKTKPKSISTA